MRTAVLSESGGKPPLHGSCTIIEGHAPFTMPTVSKRRLTAKLPSKA
jgi:hypothetical protein